MDHFVLNTPISSDTIIQGVLDSNKKFTINGLSRLGYSNAGDLCFCDREPSVDLKEISAGTIVFCTHTLSTLLLQRYPEAIFVALPDPRASFIDLSQRLLTQGHVEVSNAVLRPFGIHPSAKIDAQCIIHPETRIDEHVKIGAQCVIHRGTWIKTGAVIRDHTVIGIEGINAYAGLDGNQRNFPHFASAIIGEHVEIGAGVVVMRGILSSTLIGAGSVIGNLCNIGHGVEIGNKVWMSVGGLVGGHTHISDHATLGMGVVLRDNITIGAGAQIGMGSVVVKSVASNGSVFGNPARAVPGIQAGPSR